jgi:hypothetical protein
MGRGAAFQATQKMPKIAEICAKAIKGHSKFYGFLPILDGGEDRASFGIFQVKLNWWDDAELELIRISAGILLNAAGSNPEMKYRLNYPGIGNGNLTTAEVGPIIEDLIQQPNVTVVYRK